MESLHHYTDKSNVHGTWWFPPYPLCIQPILWVGQQEPRTQQHMLGCGLWTQRGNTSHRHLCKKTHCNSTFMAVHIWFLKIFWVNHHLSTFTCTIRGSISDYCLFPTYFQPISIYNNIDNNNNKNKIGTYYSNKWPSPTWSQWFHLSNWIPIYSILNV